MIAHLVVAKVTIGPFVCKEQCCHLMTSTGSKMQKTVTWKREQNLLWDTFQWYQTNAIASQITVYLTVCLTAHTGQHEREHQSSAILALCGGTPPVTGFHVMTLSCTFPFLSTVRSRSSTIKKQYCQQHRNCKVRASIILWTPNIHPISRFHEWAMGCLL